MMKSAEMRLGSITCLSGCLSAYRKNMLLPLIDAWIDQDQKYFSGEDRALTTMFLKTGVKLLFQDTATATTIVPENINIYFKQQLRWKKSWLTENFKTSLFV